MADNLSKECTRCGHVFYPNSYSELLNKYPSFCLGCRRFQFEFDEMQKLKGGRIVDVFYDKDKDTYILGVDTSEGIRLYLTAEDGEYGDNAFKILIF